MNAPSAEPMNKMTAESDNSSPCIRLRKNFDDLDPHQTPEQIRQTAKRDRLKSAMLLNLNKNAEHAKIMKDLETPVSKKQENIPISKIVIPARFPPESPLPEERKSLLNCFFDFSAFTGLWISASLMVSCRILLLPTKLHVNALLDLAALVPSGMITIQNIRNLIAGERDFTFLSPFDPKRRNERSLPFVERKELRPAPNAHLYLNGNPGFLFGRYGRRYVGKQQNMDGHIICIGTPGSGKSAAVAIPTLHMWTGALLAIDIKGELLKNAPVRYNRRVMDPYNPDSYGYDPFELLYLAPKSEFTHALNDILYAIIPDRDTEDPFWEQAARHYLAGVYTWAYHASKTFIEANRIIYSTPAEELVDKIISTTEGDARDHMQHFKGLSDKTLSSIMETVHNAIELFATDPVVQEFLTREPTILPRDLLEGYQIYYELPESRLQNWSPLTAMIINQFLHAMTEFPDNNPIRTLVLLDEFPQLGKATAVIDGMATLRSKGCTICLLMQSYSQLDRTYGQTARRVITDNAAYKLILSVMDPQTAQEISSMVGQHYQTQASVSTHGLLSDRQYSSSEHKQLTNLIRPEELQNLGNEALLLSPYGFCRLQKTYYFREGFTNVSENTSAH